MADRDAADDGTPPEEVERHHAVPGFGPPRDDDPAVAQKPSANRRWRNAILVIGGVVAVVIVIVVVLAVLILSAIRGAVDDVESERDETAISVSEYKSIHVGMREAKVREELGEPAKETTSGGGAAARTCLYYHQEDAGLIAGDRFRFCFVDGRLDGKSRN